MADHVNPVFDLEAFNCPTCGAYAKQTWSYATGYNKQWTDMGRGHQSTFNIDDFAFSRCTHCNHDSVWRLDKEIMVYPRTTTRNFNLAIVPKDMAADYEEALLVLNDSPKASAALSRRCLQSILRDQGFSAKSLAQEIKLAMDSKSLPSHICDSLDAIRNIGNFAAHPMKDTNSGAVVPVEPGEAEWNLDVIESLFDFYYIQPAKTQIRKDVLNAKLKSIGKPEIK